VSDDKIRELSALNGMLYEFLPPEDQKPTEDRVVHHVILKATCETPRGSRAR